MLLKAFGTLCRLRFPSRPRLGMGMGMGFASRVSAAADVLTHDVFAKVAAVFLARPCRTVAAGMGAFRARLFMGLGFLGRRHAILLIVFLPIYILRADCPYLCALASL
jgi:hypothetical protein